MSRSSRLGWRKLAVLAAAVPVLIVGAIVSAVPSANAWHANISGKADCKGIVSFTATSWTQGVDGNNTKIGIYYSVDDGKTFKPVVDDSGTTIVSKSGVRYEFTSANKNSFSDNFQLPSSWPSKVVVKATSLGDWGGDYGKEVQSRSTVVTVPPPCSKPSASITGPTCTSADAVVTLKNDGGDKATFTLHRGTDVNPFETYEVAGGKTETVKVKVDKDLKLSVHAKGMANVDADLKVPTDCTKPSATVTQVCKADASGVSVTVKNDGKVEQEFMINAGDKTIDSVKLAAGKSETKSYTFKDLGVDKGKSIKIEVHAGHDVISTQEVTNDCIDVTADVATKCDTAAGSGAVLTFTNKGKIDETFTVTRDGRAVEGSPFTLKPGQTNVQKLLKLNEDEQALIKITSSSGFSVEKTVKLDCTQTSSTTITAPSTTVPAEVLSETVVRPQLAATGSSTFLPMVLFGMLMVGVGAAVLRTRGLLVLEGAHFRK